MESAAPAAAHDLEIQRLEAEIDQSRFSVSETEAYLSRRAKARLEGIPVTAARAEAIAQAYKLGVKQGRRGLFLYAILLSGTFWGVALALSMAWSS